MKWGRFATGIIPSLFSRAALDTGGGPNQLPSRTHSNPEETVTVRRFSSLGSTPQAKSNPR